MHKSNEASVKELTLAKEQGAALTHALEYMKRQEADSGEEKIAGDFLVAYAVEQAEGLYEFRDGELRWQEPEEGNVHIEVSVRDKDDGRFVPQVPIKVTVLDQDGGEIGTHDHPFLWHPWLYHYGRNWKVPKSGNYTLKVSAGVPGFARHDKTNGKRFTSPVTVTFENVHITTGQKRS